LPYHQNDKIEIRQSEPYMYCQFVMGRDHTAHGRARHPWMTGTGGWAYFAATHYILGLRPDYDRFVIDPCLPGDWSGFSAVRRWRGATYNIEVRNPDGVEKGVRHITLNGAKVRELPVCPPGSVNKVVVEMGDA
jgi:N,N'-diacetylchitobiose phosphorylase